MSQEKNADELGFSILADSSYNVGGARVDGSTVAIGTTYIVTMPAYDAVFEIAKQMNVAISDESGVVTDKNKKDKKDKKENKKNRKNKKDKK